MLDTYNQAIHEDVACTIRTNINTANHHFIMEKINEPIIGALRGRNPENPSEGRVQENGTVSPTLTCGCESSLARVEYSYRIRKLTERECFRLMGVSDNDSDKIRAAVSKSQCYKLAGNSIVVDVMVGIFEQLFIGNQNKVQQLELF